MSMNGILGPKKKKRKYIGKYSFVNRTINLWNQLPAQTFPSRSNIFKKKVGKVIISEVRWCEMKGSELKGC